MKFEFEIDDSKIHGLVANHANSLNRTHAYTLRMKIESEVEKVIHDSQFKGLIEQAISSKADELINKAVDNKLEGWIKRKVKEILKSTKDT